MKKTFFLPTIVFTLLLGCVKDNKKDLGDLGGPYTLNGTAVVYDTLTGNHTYSGTRNITVYLKYITDSATNLTSTVAGASGQYSFKGIDPSKGYTVYALMDSNRLHYYGKIDYPSGSIKDRQSDSLVLTPSESNQNGIFYNVSDNTHAAFSGATVFIFANNQARDNKDTLNASWRLKTDSFGRVLKMTLTPNVTYYTYATGVFKNQFLEGTDDFTVNVQGITKRPLTLTPAKTNGLQIIIQVNDANPVANCKAYLYNNIDLWNNPDDSTGVGSILSPLTSGLDGKCATLFILTKGHYYIRAYAKFGALTVRGSDSFEIGGDTITIRKVPVTINNL
jgi:hypothetical protein